MKFLIKYIKNYWKLFIAAVIFLTIEALCDLMQPTIMSKIIDIGVANKQMDYVMNKGIIMLLITALGAVAACGRNILSNYVSQKFSEELRLDLFKKIQGFSFDNLDKFKGASLVTRLTNDVTQLQNFCNGLMRIFVKAPLVCIGSIIMAAKLNPRMSLVLVVVIPIVIIFIFANMQIGYPFFIKVQKALDKVNTVMREYLSGVRVVKAFNRFDYEIKRFEGANGELASASTNAMRLMSVFSPIIRLTVNLGIVAVIWIGGFRVNNGNMYVGQVIAFINYMTQILFSLMMISFVFTVFVRARASAERIGEVFMEENERNCSKAIKENVKTRVKVDFEKVYFSYAESKGEPIIKNITFRCMSGETIGIIGATGAGKTSLVNLIPCFYNVTSGSVKVDGIDVNHMDLKTLREKIAIVPQKSILFTGTVKDNILWGKENASDEEIKNAASMAQAHDFISSFPEGYETKIGQGGVNFSGGQKQRISIARALIKKPDILILDDCTSAVDAATETRIRLSLKKYFKNLTCFIIAQRITSVMEADKIIVMDNGEIAGVGKHEQLMKDCNIYKEIFYSQIGKEVV
ncbi:ABC transporter ATP-binding protein [Clostridium scatologenes]|uniref:ABC transporter related protein n=1 Tax=Clostridium scatologenes TaxID=1548 RepID=A0A0E3JMG0_CLOSL|nr:ABC transporter ATP-binding protein [Clostridium scatologenes]AKA68010.1 ABC transporter related protein [Clostridium scatologenes]